MAKKVFTDESLETLIDETKSYVDSAVSKKANSSHTHSISNITNLQSALDGKAASSHTHAISNISGLQSALDGKAASSHGRHVPSTCTSITDWNSATTTGWYMAQNASNAPRANTWYFGYVIAHTTEYVYQEIYSFTASTDAKNISKYIRAKKAGTWGEWTNVTVAKAVPSDAKFTDTTYTLGSFGITATASELNKLDGVTATTAELNYVGGVTSNIQTQLDGKSSTSHTHKYAGSSSTGGSANSAVKLATARAINGVNFDGTSAITITANPKTTTLTNVDLNNYTTTGFYHGGGGNGCTNVPSGIDAFGMIVFKNAGGYSCQLLVGGNNNSNVIYIRTYASGTWTSWETQYGTANKPTPADIGAATSEHTHKYAGSSSAGGAATSANKVNNSLTVKLNGGTTEGTNLFTFNGSSAKSVNITPSSIGAATSSHNHDDRYYTETEVDTKLSGKANTSHGNHVPATQTASNKVFLRNDNTWATVTPANIGAAASSHTHKVANISDLTATATELNYMDGVTSNVQAQLDGKAASSHKHTVSQISDLTATAAELNKLDGVTATTTELNYVDGVTSNIQTQLDRKITNNPFNSSGTHGEKGYIAFAQLKITATYVNRPIEFELICRGKGTPCYVSVVFSNSNTTDPSIESLKYCGTDYGIFAVKSTTSTWLLYHTKTEAYDDVTIARIQAASQGITITYPASFITTKPTSGVTNASLGGSVAYAGSATSATKATQDASGNTITSTYATKSELNTAKSNLQASIDAKQSTITGGASTITSSNLTASRALISNGSGKVAVSAVTSTELGYLDGVTSSVQTQLNDKAPIANGQYAVTTAGTGAAYTATVPSIKSLTAGVSFIMIPNTVSTTTAPTLNVNSLGAKSIKRRLSNLPTSLQNGYSNAWLAQGKPFRVVYDGTAWIVEGHEKPSAADLYGLTATITELNYCDGVTSSIQTQLNALSSRIAALETILANDVLAINV